MKRKQQWNKGKDFACLRVSSGEQQEAVRAAGLRRLPTPTHPVKVHVRSRCSVLVRHWTAPPGLKGERQTAIIPRRRTVNRIVIPLHV